MAGSTNSARTTIGIHTISQRAPSLSQRPVTFDIDSGRSVVEVTRDGGNYVEVDLTECRDAQAIRDRIASQLHIPKDSHSDFAIHLTEIGGLTIGDALDDETLLFYRQFAEKARPRRRFIVQRTGTPSDVPIEEGSMTMSSPWGSTPTSGRMTPNLPILEDSDSDSAETITRFTHSIFSQLPNARRDSFISRHRRTLSESHSQRLKAKQINVTVTQDQKNYLIDITEYTNAQAIRKGIFSKLHIPESDQTNFGIYYSKLSDFVNCTILDDNQLFVRCRRLGDEKGSIKLLVQRIKNPSNHRASFSQHQPNSNVLEPLRVSIPLVHPKPSSRSPRASTMDPSPRTESAPPLFVRETSQVSKVDSSSSAQNTNHQDQLQSLSQAPRTDFVRSRSSSLINMPSRRSSGVSPTALLALKQRSRYAAANPGAGTAFSTPTGSVLDTPRTSSVQPLKGTATPRETANLFRSSIPESAHEIEDRHKALLENIKLPPIDQRLGPVEGPIHLEKSAYKYPHQTKYNIKSQNETNSVINVGGPDNGTESMIAQSDPGGSGPLDDSRLDSKNGEVQPPDSPVTINGEMPATEILEHLHKHGCRNVTSQLGGLKVSEHPISTGGFGDIYRAKLPSGRRIGLKCVRLRIDPNDDGGKKQLKRAARELYTWSKCQHSNILQLIGVTEYRGQIAMVSPWMENGDLSWFLSRNPQVNRCSICVQIADGVNYLHENNIVHSDLKAANILVSEDFTPKICDFGGAYLKNYTLRFSTTTDRPGFSVRWAPPEVIEGEASDTSVKADVYSLAMTILEVISGEPPYACVPRDIAVINRVLSKRHPIRPEKKIPTTSQQANVLWDLLTRCWAYSPSDRPDAFIVRDTMMNITPEGLC